MVEERIHLLGRLKAYQDRFDQIIVVCDRAVAKPGKNESLLQIRVIAEGALAL